MTSDLPRRALLAGVPAAAAVFLAPDGARADRRGTARGTTPRAEGSGRPPGTAPCPRLAELEREYAGRIGGFALDVGTGTTVGHRARERFPMLSTFKVLAAGAILHRARTSEPGLLDRVLHWTRDDLVEYSPVTSQHVQDGLTVTQVCEAAIGQSDNTAGNLMLSRIGGPAGLTRFVRTIGDRTTRSDRWETQLNLWAPGELMDTTSPAAMAADLRALTVGSALHPADRDLLLTWMRGCATGAARIRAALPGDWTVGNKTGSSGDIGAANDIAIAFPPGRAPLVLSIYTHRNDPSLPYEDRAVSLAAAILLDQVMGR